MKTADTYMRINKNQINLFHAQIFALWIKFRVNSTVPPDKRTKKKA